MTDTDGFVVWMELTGGDRHFYCRGCRRAGDILKLVQDIKRLNFNDACKELSIPNPYLDGEEAFSNLSKLAIERPEPKIDAWKLGELEVLISLYPRIKLALQRERARAYLYGRGIPFDLAANEGLGYIPAFNEISGTASEIEAYKRWCDRIMFPVQTPDGKAAYCGRTLFLWEPGMDEDEHKAKLDAYNLQMQEKCGKDASKYVVRRWLYTYLGGYFNLQCLKESDCPTFVEGPFDVLACKSAGLDQAISIGTIGLDVRVLPTNICSAIMALDFDPSGSSAAARLAKGLRAKGIDVSICAPAGGKDWSAAYRLHGSQSLAPIIEAIESRRVCTRCGISSRLSSKPFQILDDQLLCGYCASANVAPDPTQSVPVADPVAESIDDITEGPNLCISCLDQDRETAAYYEHGDFMYCADHYPPLQGINSFTSRAQEAIPAFRSAKVECWRVEDGARMRESILRGYIIEYQREAKRDLGPYQPVSLPQLPRSACPCITLDWNKDGSQTRQRCRGKVMENGFCWDHRLSYEFLEIGAQLGYPEVKVPFSWKRETLHRTILAGSECWESASVSPARLQQAMDFLKKKYTDQLVGLSTMK
jgi:hypothetical protein